MTGTHTHTDTHTQTHTHRHTDKHTQMLDRKEVSAGDKLCLWERDRETAPMATAAI